MPRDPHRPDWIPPDSSATARTIRIIFLVALAILFLWLTIQVDLVIFSGFLLAILLGRLSEKLRRGTGLPHSSAIAVVVIALAAAALAISWFFAQSVSSQINQLSQQLPVALEKVRSQIRHIPWLNFVLSTAQPGRAAAGGLGSLFGIASNTFEVIAGFVVLVFIGLYLAAEPMLYLDGLLHLAPPTKRARIRTICGVVVQILWSWMLGRLFSMSVVGVCVTVGLWAIGVPVPVALGLLAGLLTFVPYLGSIVSAVPSLLIAFTVGPRYPVYVILLYAAVHSIEGYVLVPIVQRRAAHLPPALTLAAQVVLGALAGVLGIAFATPLVAALLPIVRLAYVEDVLGDRPDEGAAEPPRRRLPMDRNSVPD